MDRVDLWSQTTYDSGLNSSKLLAEEILCMDSPYMQKENDLQNKRWEAAKLVDEKEGFKSLVWSREFILYTDLALALSWL